MLSRSAISVNSRMSREVAIVETGRRVKTRGTCRRQSVSRALITSRAGWQARVPLRFEYIGPARGRSTQHAYREAHRRRALFRKDIARYFRSVIVVVTADRMKLTRGAR